MQASVFNLFSYGNKVYMIYSFPSIFFLYPPPRVNKFRMSVKAEGNSSSGEMASLEDHPLLDMGECTWENFSCGWDCVTFLHHMDSLIYNKG